MKRTIMEFTSGLVSSGGAAASQYYEKDVMGLEAVWEIFGIAMTAADWMTTILFFIGVLSFLMAGINQIKKFLE